MKVYYLEILKLEPGNESAKKWIDYINKR
jgi:hypothetical protein